MQTRTQTISVKLLFAAVLLLPAAAISAQNPENFNATIVRGVKAFRVGQFADAAKAFQQALILDPKSIPAHLYLASAYSSQVGPNLKTAENLALADKAIALFRQIPAEDRNRYMALKQIATLYRYTDRPDQARNTERATLDLQPDNPDTHYTIGVIDWMQAYKFATMTLGAAGLTDDGVGNTHMDSATCDKILTHNTPLIDDAITHFTRAVDLKPTYADAMQYLNLAYRRKADFDCAKPTARTQDIATADNWIVKATAARKANQAEAEAAAAPK